MKGLGKSQAEMELELQVALAKNKELERLLTDERNERIVLTNKIKENAQTISQQQEEISALNESEEILNFDIARLETENDQILRKQREESALRENLQQELDDALER